jgi:hypothetical protein
MRGSKKDRYSITSSAAMNSDGEMADHFACASSHASASSKEKEYSWSRTPERILPPSARFTM